MPNKRKAKGKSKVEGRRPKAEAGKSGVEGRKSKVEGQAAADLPSPALDAGSSAVVPKSRLDSGARAPHHQKIHSAKSA
jgi:hypothetical protein